jgi:hypothetical protein
MKAVWINSQKRSLILADYSNADDLREMIGCEWLQIGHQFRNRDVIYVDEEGLLKPQRMFFTVRGGHQPFAGSGVLVGREKPGKSDTYDPRTNLLTIANIINFHTVQEVRDMVSRGGNIMRYDEDNLYRVAVLVQQFNDTWLLFTVEELMERMKSIAERELHDRNGYVATGGFCLTTYNHPEGGRGVHASLSDVMFTVPIREERDG